jgi:hypothetical protein
VALSISSSVVSSAKVSAVRISVRLKVRGTSPDRVSTPKVAAPTWSGSAKTARTPAAEAAGA